MPSPNSLRRVLRVLRDTSTEAYEEMTTEYGPEIADAWLGLGDDDACSEAVSDIEAEISELIDPPGTWSRHQ